MSKYTKYSTDLNISYHTTGSNLLGKDMWVVKEAFNYHVGTEDSNVVVKVPVGYLTDGASVPRIFWNILPPWSKYGQATVVHDFLCDYGYLFVDGKNVSIPREEIDYIFEEAMYVLDVPRWKIWVMSTAVNLYRMLFNKKVEPPAGKLLIEHYIQKNAREGFYELDSLQKYIVKQEISNAKKITP